ncbi:hypothetical protein OAV62_02220 [bacterium]|nr:hypothetical protein [bacterium]
MKDIDVLSIHARILSLLENDISKKSSLDKKQKDLQYIYDHVSLDDQVKENTFQAIKELESICERLRNRTDINFYLLQTSVLVRDYKKELSRPIELSFMGKPKKATSEKKDRIQREFIKIAKEFVPELANYKSLDTTKCTKCGFPTIEQTNLSTFICTKCGLDQEISKVMISYRDSERINITSKYTYTRRIHFRDCINQFQGKQQSTIPQDIYDQIYEMLRSHGLELPGKTKQEKYKNVTKHHIGLFLREIGEANRYEDKNLIYHSITGNKLDDITHLEDVLIRDFDILDELYEQMFIQTKKISRKNFIHTQYVLYQLLRRHKYPCKKNDFNLLKTTELKLFQDNICSLLFDKLGWNFSAVF